MHQWCLLVEAFIRLIMVRLRAFLGENLTEVPSGSQRGNSESLIIDSNLKVFAEIQSAIFSCRKLLGHSGCLKEALVFQEMLHSRGVRSQLVFGAKLDGKERFSAHAWLEANGEIIHGQDPQNSYQRFN